MKDQQQNNLYLSFFNIQFQKFMQHINKNLLQSTFNEESITNVLISEPGKETKFTIIVNVLNGTVLDVLDAQLKISKHQTVNSICYSLHYKPYQEILRYLVNITICVTDALLQISKDQTRITIIQC